MTPGLPAGVVATTTGTSTSGTAAGAMDAVEYVAAGQNSATFRGTVRTADGCPYLVGSGGTHYYLPGRVDGERGAVPGSDVRPSLYGACGVVGRGRLPPVQAVATAG
ncbi:hypothetical protein ACFU6I_11305 [Streptomyces sp. NPDC057486]|uniref:hypothetical protein n=1 Tax=Streptomyces sp. NPDC057486 TaxID=3346145 RepID=UPI0036B78B87